MGWFALKIDLDKDYDRMNQNFVEDCLGKIGLDRFTIRIIVKCVKKAFSSILLNDRKGEKFVHSTGSNLDK